MDMSVFREVLAAVFALADWLCTACIVYAGIKWMLGDRTRAMEQLMGACAGYIIVRYAPTLQQFLSGIVGA